MTDPAERPWRPHRRTVVPPAHETGLTAEEVSRPAPARPAAAAPVDESDPEDGHAT